VVALDSNDVKRVQANSKLKVYQKAATDIQYLGMNIEKAPFDNVMVRQAFNYAIDKDAILQVAANGFGEVATSIIPSALLGHKDGPYTYDPKKAKDMLKTARFDFNQTIKLWAYGDVGKKKAEIVQANLADIGVKLNLELMANPTLRDKIDKGDFDLCLGAWSPDFADPYMFMNFWFDSAKQGLPGNRSFYKNDKVDELLRKAEVSAKVEERKKLYSDAQDIIMQDAPYIFLYQIQTIVPLRANVQGYVFNPMLESMYNFESISKK